MRTKRKDTFYVGIKRGRVREAQTKRSANKPCSLIYITHITRIGNEVDATEKLTITGSIDERIIHKLN